jgi:three-Cys-motif partner protein
MAKSWGWWTRHKLDILGNYLQAFATASSSVAERIYLDLFAGWPENVSRETNERIPGSVHRALATDPPFTRVCLFELPAKAQQLKAALGTTYPGRDEVRVYPGDCNTTIEQAVAELSAARVRWAPTFAFIDQFDTEVHWSTLEQIAAFKDQRRTKAEMWILFGTSFYGRGLQLQQELLDAKYAEGLSLMFGSEQWRPIAEGRRRGLLGPERWRAEIVNLMRWRLQTELGYSESRSLTIRNTNGNELYDMIFVTDHLAGDKIMSWLYGRSPAQQEAMRLHALTLRRDKRRGADGQDTLFDVGPELFVPAGDGYEQALVQEPPHEPYRLP